MDLYHIPRRVLVCQRYLELIVPLKDAGDPHLAQGEGGLDAVFLPGQGDKAGEPLLPSEDGLVHIDYYVSDEEFYEFRLSEDGVLTMSSAFNKSWTDYVGTKAGAEYRRLRLRLPEEALTSLSISTTNEDMALSSVSVLENLSLSVNGGSISLEKLDAGKLIELNAKNGGRSGAVAGGYDYFAISCQVKKGESNLPESKDGGEKQLNISCNNGDVNIALEP